MKRTLILLFFIGFQTAVFASAIKEKLSKILDGELAKSKTPGAVLLVSSPTLGTISVAGGLSEVKDKTPMETTNNFRIASMSKTFLAVTVLKLVEEDYFSLDDKIEDLLPDSVDTDRIPNGNLLTVRQLLQMRSGIPNYTDSDAYYELIDKLDEKEWTAQRCVKLVYDEKPNFKPGSSYEYCNTNYLLLQLIVEEATGKSYAAAIREKILKPLNMKNTFIEIHESTNENYLYTNGYTVEDNKLTDVTDYNDGFGLADGGIISDAEDMKTFVQALLENKTLLPEPLLKTMLSTKDEYGLGIYYEEFDDDWVWTHNGNSSGFSGQYYYFEDIKLTIIVLTNCFDTDILSNVVEKVLPIVISGK
ncbi:serine hydrolase domain-containing protein [Legionella waltersii]|nr:serine hydrolase domain-containing protein [Legionella waltersii]